MVEKLSIDHFYREARKTGKVLGLRCESGHISVPPSHSCIKCRSTNLEVVELSGRGVVVSFTQVHVKSKEFPLETPYTLVLVKLDEGPNLLGIIGHPGNSKDDINTVRIGTPVRATFRNLEKEEVLQKNMDSEDQPWPRIFFENV